MWRCLFKGLDWDSRLEARQLKMIQRTKRDIQLFRLWKRSPYIEVRIAAIYKLKNQGLLSHIAQAEQVDELRYEAVRKLTDKTLLDKIAIKDKSDYIRYIAHRKCACQKGSELWDASEMDEDAEKVLSAIMERNAYLHFLATGQEPDEEWW
ncbi:hypothetical protein [Cloacibacillus evryensis]|uniref:hypothetical protein n=1 Tax=Cloacibacillus evryensis TaxID=508460 RepID=UPI002B21993B|nr:hypothetical protein [Cloacibacillus evryensis]MEA5035795.1 hypothetical protein [Cloacibacillus evryensis]